MLRFITNNISFSDGQTANISLLFEQTGKHGNGIIRCQYKCLFQYFVENTSALYEIILAYSFAKIPNPYPLVFLLIHLCQQPKYVYLNVLPISRFRCILIARIIPLDYIYINKYLEKWDSSDAGIDNMTEQFSFSY